ncbi:hypothetical protein Dimus_007147 [Dionaea muscipula]
MKMGKGKKLHPIRVIHGVVFVAAILLLPCCVLCQDEDELNTDTGNPNKAAVKLLTQLIYSQMSNYTKVFEPEIKQHLGFCITDVDADWNKAFNFSDDLSFLSNCLEETKDVPQRVCSAAEVKFYFSNFYDEGRKNADYLKPNKNCNLTSFPDGCEPGWACSVGKNEKVDLKNTKELPTRTTDCKACCEGFFCPKGITCMIPCPLGAYCPMAKLNRTTGACDPYAYQIPPGKPNHTCGGADIWADVTTGGDVFCSAGSYCPSTIKKVGCGRGHFCRTGSTSEQPCFQLATCDANTANQNIQAYGIILISAVSIILILVYNCSDQVLHTRERRVAKSRERAIRSARETAQARERWKSAKDVARKRAVGLQAQLSRTFSRKNLLNQTH